ncbi:MAG: gliding motility-associated C-terminal domain-containing protein [Bacteroidetes bacterium]|nr:gliding motility-associated C-terminal domain-containing protein [Bacteroidota bacterium]
MKKILTILLFLFGGFYTMAQLPNYVPTNGLSAWYSFTGNAVDGSTNMNDGTVTGATLTTDRFTNLNSAYSFDGVDDTIVVANSPSLQFTSNNQSVSLWLKVPSLPNPLLNDKGILAKMDEHLDIDITGNSAQGFEIGFAQNGNGSIFYRAKSGNSSGWAGTMIDYTLLTPNTWENIIFIFSSVDDSVYAYLNGVKVNSALIPSGSMIGQNTMPMVIGWVNWLSNGNPAYLYDGILDDIGLWNRALTTCEIQEIYTNSTHITSSTNTTICQNQLPYSWNGHSYNTAGSHVVTLVSAAGCDSIVTLNLIVNANTSSTTNTTICTNQLPYSWNGHSYNTSGPHVVILVNSEGCDSVATLNLTVNPITTSTTNSTICVNQLPYSWNGQVYNTGGTHSVILMNAAGCDSIATLNLTIKPMSFTSLDINICEDTTYFGYNSPGTYIDTFPAANGCDSIRKLNLTVTKNIYPYLGEDKNICNGDTIKLNPGTFSTYLWQNFSTNPYLVVSAGGIYSVKVTDVCGIKYDTIKLRQIDCEQYFPNAFSPNDDRINDIFKIITTSYILDFQLVIYNRYGHILFKTNDPSKGWDGLYKNKKQPIGTYIWVSSFKKDGKFFHIQGTVALIR